MAGQIRTYQASWHPDSNVGLIELKYADGTRSTLNFNAQNAIEFTVVLQLLQGSETPFVTINGWISTGPDDPGDPAV